MNDKSHLAKALDTWRAQACGLRELARLSGLSPSTVQDAISGRSRSSALLLERIIAAAGGRITVELPVDGRLVRFPGASPR